MSDNIQGIERSFMKWDGFMQASMLSKFPLERGNVSLSVREREVFRILHVKGRKASRCFRRGKVRKWAKEFRGIKERGDPEYRGRQYRVQFVSEFVSRAALHVNFGWNVRRFFIILLSRSLLPHFSFTFPVSVSFEIIAVTPSRATRGE